MRLGAAILAGPPILHRRSTGCTQRPGHFLDEEKLDDVASFEVVVTLYADTALQAVFHLPFPTPCHSADPAKRRLPAAIMWPGRARGNNRCASTEVIGTASGPKGTRVTVTLPKGGERHDP